MNKQEVIKSLEKKRDRALDNSEYYRDKENEKYEKMNRARVDSYTLAIQLVEQIEEPQAEKVEVTEFVAEWYETNKASIERAVSMQIQHGFTPLVEPRSKFDMWFFDESNHPIETLIRMKDGYTVKPKRWVVKLPNNDYFSSWVSLYSLEADGAAYKFYDDVFVFDDRAKAEAVATLVEGTVEEID